MKRSLPLTAAVALVAALSGGCVVAPYDTAPVTHYYSPYPYYAESYAPVYPAPVYVGPPVHFNFGLNYQRGGHRHGPHQHWRGFGRGHGHGHGHGGRGWRR